MSNYRDGHGVVNPTGINNEGSGGIGPAGEELLAELNHAYERPLQTSGSLSNVSGAGEAKLPEADEAAAAAGEAKLSEADEAAAAAEETKSAEAAETVATAGEGGVSADAETEAADYHRHPRTPAGSYAAAEYQPQRGAYHGAGRSGRNAEHGLRQGRDEDHRGRADGPAAGAVLRHHQSGRADHRLEISA